MGYKNSTLSRHTLKAQLKLPTTCKHSLYGAGKVVDVLVSDAKGDLVITCQFGSSKLGFLYSRTPNTTLQIPASQRILYDKLLSTLDDTYKIFEVAKASKLTPKTTTGMASDLTESSPAPEALAEVIESVVDVIEAVELDSEISQPSVRRNKLKKKTDADTVVINTELVSTKIDNTEAVDLQNTEETLESMSIADIALDSAVADTVIPETVAFDAE
jgi:hypothetical protein